MIKSFPKTHFTIAAVVSAIVASAVLMSPSSKVEANRAAYNLDLDKGQVDTSSPITAATGDSADTQQPDVSEETNTAFATSPSTTTDETADPVQQASADVAQQPAANARTSGANQPQTVEEAIAQIDREAGFDWQEFEIRSGDTLSSLFKQAGFDNGLMLSVIHGEGEASDLQKLYAGETIRFATDSEGQLVGVDLKRNLLETLEIRKEDSGYAGKTEIREPEVRPAFATGVIDGSLYVAAKEAGMSDRLTMQMVGIFGWNIDFVYDVRKGDSFEVVYEELYLDGEKFDTGEIISARLINRGEEVVALRYTDSNGDTDYYGPDGSSMRKAFLRTPINARVSSSFNLQRRHPVLGVVRPHEGTDYAAPTGTPIKAAGDGRVVFAGRKGGYGRTVVINHGDNISTLYAHMSRLGQGIRVGTRVKQGQTVGHVGASGLATGPHLHYEFRINGVPRNSRTVKLPDAKPVPQTEMARFNRFAEQEVAKLELFSQNSQLALATED